MKCWIATVLGVAVMTAGALPAAAQCSMCRTALAAHGHAASDAFNRAILILLVPAVALFGTVFALVFRYADSAEEPPKEEAPEE